MLFIRSFTWLALQTRQHLPGLAIVAAHLWTAASFLQ
jgi:hypothetical protein